MLHYLHGRVKISINIKCVPSDLWQRVQVSGRFKEKRDARALHTSSYAYPDRVCQPPSIIFFTFYICALCYQA